MSLTRVDFYLLADPSELAHWLLACRLLEKAYVTNHDAFVYCNSRQEAEKLDKLLWVFKDNSFIPHHIWDENQPSPIQIGYGREPNQFAEILLNLAEVIPPFYSRFTRVIEIVANNEKAKGLSRTHYREYRSNECELFTHKITDAFKEQGLS